MYQSERFLSISEFAESVGVSGHGELAIKWQGNISEAPDAVFVRAGTRRCRNSFGKTNATANATQYRATETQFAQNALSFYADGDVELNPKEFTKVAAALLVSACL